MPLFDLTPQDLEAIRLDDERRMAEEQQPSVEPQAPVQEVPYQVPQGHVPLPYLQEGVPLSDSIDDALPTREELEGPRSPTAPPATPEQLAVEQLPPPEEAPPAWEEQLPPNLRDKYRVTHDINQPGYKVPKELKTLPVNSGKLVDIPAKQQKLLSVPEAEPTWYHNEMMVSRAFVDGQTLGLANEIGAMIAAGFVKALDWDADYGTVATDMHDILQQETNKFSADHPVMATSASIAGALFSPVTLKGGKEIIKMPTIRAKAAASTALATVEGGTAGAGYGQPGERVPASQMGAATGFAVGSALSGASSIASGFLSKKQLREGATEIVPLNLSAPEGSWLATAYKWPGTTFGGGGLKRQSDKVIKRFEQDILHVGALLDKTTKAANRTLAVAKVALARSKTSATKKFEDASDAAAATEKRAKAVAERRAIQQVLEQVRQVAKLFRDTASKEVMPSGISKEGREEIMKAANMNERLKVVKKWWQETGFSSVKNAKLNVDPAQLVDDMETVISKDKILSTDEKTQLFDIAQRHMEDLSGHEGAIPGRVLSDIRMQLSTAFGNMDNLNLRVAGRKMLDPIDELIESQLKGKTLRDWMSDKRRWRVFTVFRQAVEDASVGKRGNFTPKGWQQAAWKQNAQQLADTTSPLYQRSQKALEVMEDSDQMIKDAEEAYVKQAIRAKEHTVRAARAAKRSEIEAAKKRFGDTPLGQQEIDRLKGEKLQLDTDLKYIKSMSPSGGNSFVDDVIRKMWLSVGTGFATGNIFLASMAPAIAYVMQNPRFQKALVEQGTSQKWIKDIVEEYGSSARAGVTTGNIERENRP